MGTPYSDLALKAKSILHWGPSQLRKITRYTNPAKNFAIKISQKMKTISQKVKKTPKKVKTIPYRVSLMGRQCLSIATAVCSCLHSQWAAVYHMHTTLQYIRKIFSVIGCGHMWTSVSVQNAQKNRY